MIELVDIHKSFADGKRRIHVLRGIDLCVAKGEIFGVIGRSGAGKSTLIRCMNLLERPCRGQVICDGVDLTALNQKALRSEQQRIGMIFQHFNLLHSRTVYENIALPMELAGIQNIKCRVKELLVLVELTDFSHVYPDALSGGQCQRVAIARALACQPKVLLCDEATSSLDPQTTRGILGLIKKISSELQLTVVVITHEMDVIKRLCHRVAVLDEGQVVEQGNVLDIFSAPQTTQAQKLTQSDLSEQLPEHYLQRLHTEKAYGDATCVKLQFIGQQTMQPLLAEMREQTGTESSIVQASMEWIQNEPVGVTLCELGPTAEKASLGIKFLTQQHVKVEICGYVTTTSNH